MDENNVEKLIERYKIENNAQVKIRLLIIINFLKGRSAIEISLFLHISRHTVYYWIRRYEIQGIDGLYTQRHTGRPPKVKKKDLILALNNSPAEYGFKEWNISTIKEYLKNEQEVSVHPNYIYSLLKEIGYSFIHPKKEKKVRMRTKKGAYLTLEHIELMKKVARMLDAPIEKIITEEGLEPILSVIESDQTKTILEGRTERGVLTISYKEHI